MSKLVRGPRRDAIGIDAPSMYVLPTYREFGIYAERYGGCVNL